MIFKCFYLVDTSLLANMSEMDFPAHTGKLLAGSVLLSLNVFNSMNDGPCWILGICRVSSEIHCIILGGSNVLQTDEL